jgi:hypothetical protein
VGACMRFRPLGLGLGFLNGPNWPNQRARICMVLAWLGFVHLGSGSPNCPKRLNERVRVCLTGQQPNGLRFHGARVCS